MSKIICMASPKGGSGKTILTATFATFLSNIGKRVLMIDTDASTNGLSLLYLKEIMVQYETALSERKKPMGTYEFGEFLEYPEPVKLPTTVDLIPATYSFINTENTDLSRFIEKLKFTIEKVKDTYDYIFLDAQAGSDQFAHACMNSSISNEVIIVSEYDPLSAAGVERLKALFREDLTYNRTWVLLNKMLPDFVQSFSDFLEVAKYLSPIPWDAEVVKAYARRKLALDTDYGNEFTLAIMKTLKSLLGDEISTELSKWITDKATPLKEPIEKQYQDTLMELETLLRLRKDFDRKDYSRTFYQRSYMYFTTFTFFLSSAFLIWRYLTPDNSANTSSMTYLSIAFLVFAIGVIFFFYISYKTVSKEKNEIKSIQSYEIKLRIESLEEKLKKLDALRSAELEDLIKNNRQRKLV